MEATAQFHLHTLLNSDPVEGNITSQCDTYMDIEPTTDPINGGVASERCTSPELMRACTEECIIDNQGRVLRARKTVVYKEAASDKDFRKEGLMPRDFLRSPKKPPKKTKAQAEPPTARKKKSDETVLKELTNELQTVTNDLKAVKKGQTAVKSHVTKNQKKVEQEVEKVIDELEDVKRDVKRLEELRDKLERLEEGLADEKKSRILGDKLTLEAAIKLSSEKFNMMLAQFHASIANPSSEPYVAFEPQSEACDQAPTDKELDGEWD